MDACCTTGCTVLQPKMLFTRSSTTLLPIAGHNLGGAVFKSFEGSNDARPRVAYLFIFCGFLPESSKLVSLFDDILCSPVPSDLLISRVDLYKDRNGNIHEVGIL